MLLLPGFLESCLLIAALAAACAVRPWRMLQGTGRGLLVPLVASLVLVPVLWWGWRAPLSLALGLLGAQFVLLALGWPLAVLVFLAAGVAGAVLGDVSWPGALGAALWQGIVPATAGLVAGAALRRAAGPQPFLYLVGRAFLLPMAATFGVACLAHALAGRHEALGDAAPAVFALAGLLDGMFTGMAIALLVLLQPGWVATWSDRLYVPGSAAWRHRHEGSAPTTRRPAGRLGNH
ncbi:MAG TPA: hypothetical protein VFE82_08845 [Ramlibacter sp.]|jgi:uncharacterized membrane protein|uniref:hypothetical protein n=1 Tax=Ramlibacter sp. TaxID=1917967 RepID=UPI002D2975B9|nr:hypothetical protein [Ramlibacter sp.]HZY18577.1 hypothetical protein [Ramlibacter sp.]